jgi:hypothetical protein
MVAEKATELEENPVAAKGKREPAGKGKQKNCHHPSERRHFRLTPTRVECPSGGFPAAACGRWAKRPSSIHGRNSEIPPEWAAPVGSG